MATTRHSLDQQPLLDNEAAELDNRFAIDEDLAEEQPSADTSSSKYPPLPPSYDDTIRVDARSKRKWNPAGWFTISRTTKEHIQACFPRTSEGDLLTFNTAFGGCYKSIMRCWPTNRFAQASVFIIGLWFLCSSLVPRSLRVQVKTLVAVFTKIGTTRIFRRPSPLLFTKTVTSSRKPNGNGIIALQSRALTGCSVWRPPAFS